MIPGLKPNRSNFVNQVKNAMEVKPSQNQPNNGISVKMPNMMKQPQMQVTHKPAPQTVKAALPVVKVDAPKEQVTDGIQIELNRIADALESFTKVQIKLLKQLSKNP